MSKMISVASGFQYSVNIAYDLNDNNKLKSFIPTKSSLDLLEEILNSTDPTSTERARVLVGAYGKGKSHIVLAILAILMKKDINLFEKALPKIKEDPQLYQCIENYYDSPKKILPVVISGSNTSLTQAFISSLHNTLSMYNLLDVMPETNYKAAVQVIEKWRKEYPETYEKFQNAIALPVSNFIDELKNYNIDAYREFENLYPKLTSGSIFSPFVGFDVVELYTDTVKALKTKGYTGIYVVYDEFSKFLETNIAQASVSDTKMLQDFAEKCNRSGELQLHIMLISHKEIANYIDRLPKQKLDGWRGVSERFKHVRLNNNFMQTYEIIESVIQKDNKYWNNFCHIYSSSFNALVLRYQKHSIFNDVEENKINNIIYGCYPLHPVSTFILPRISEKVAQNERTLFTFLSATSTSTLPSFLEQYNDDHFEVITPDYVYDYFEPLFRKEAYGENIHEYYILTEYILGMLQSNTLESKIVKSISLIYILEQFDKLKPTVDELMGIYSVGYSPEEIVQAIENLIKKEYVIYLKRSNNFLQLKRTSGVDIQQKIKDVIESQCKRISIKDILNSYNIDSYIYPSRYNNERDMIRYFSFEFIDEEEVNGEVNWNIKSETIDSDGVIYGIVPQREESINGIKNSILETSRDCDRIIFIIPRHYCEIENAAKEFKAICILLDESSNDKILFDEYEVIYEDLREVLNSFIQGYTRPEEYKSEYIYNGAKVKITRKAALTELLSTICDRVYSKTPLINNESINKNEITSVTNNSRKKIITALLRNELESNLGFSGSGQEVAIMRSTLIRTGIWDENNGFPRINLHPKNNDNMEKLLAVIEEFILEAKQSDHSSFKKLYDRLILPEYHIGLRKGVIPIYLAVVIHQYKREIIISDKNGQIAISADVLLQINAKPELFTLSYLDWTPEKENYVKQITEIFSKYIVDAEVTADPYDFAASSMRRWYLALPKCTRESKFSPDGGVIPKEYQSLLKLLKQNISNTELLFEKIPKVFEMDGHNSSIVGNIKDAKTFYDNYLPDLKKYICEGIKKIYAIPEDQIKLSNMSLSSTIKDWCETLDQSVFDQLFSDGTEKCLKVFKNISNDDDLTISTLAKLATDFRIEDWDDKIKDLFFTNMKKYKETAESYHSLSVNNKDSNTNINSYQITFTNLNGDSVTKHFNKVEETGRGKLLYNQVTAALDSMGRSISTQEKRQVLMEILKNLCE